MCTSTKASDWLFLGILFVGAVGLTVVLNGIAFWTTYGNSNNFIIVVAPLVISALVAYAMSLRRFHSPYQRRMLRGLLFAFIGVIGVTSGVVAYLTNYSSKFCLCPSWYSFGPLDPFVDPLIILVSLPLMIAGFQLAAPRKHSPSLQTDEFQNGKPSRETSDVSQDVENPPLSMKMSQATQADYGYLPVAGLSTLIATIVTFEIMFLSVPTAIIDWFWSTSTYGWDCYAYHPQCDNLLFSTIAVVSTLGFVLGIIASVSLLHGRYHRVVPVAITFLSLAAILPLALDAWEWGILPLPLLMMCLISILLVALQHFRFHLSGIQG